MHTHTHTRAHNILNAPPPPLLPSGQCSFARRRSYAYIIYIHVICILRIYIYKLYIRHVHTNTYIYNILYRYIIGIIIYYTSADAAAGVPRLDVVTLTRCGRHHRRRRRHRVHDAIIAYTYHTRADMQIIIYYIAQSP